MSAHSHIDAEPSVPAGALSRLTAMGPRLVFSLLLALGSYALVPHPGFFSPRFGVVAFVQGRAQNPFARRVLALFFVKATVALTPEPLRNRIDALVEPRIRPRFAEELRNVKPGYGTALVASIFWSILALTAFFYLIGHLALTALGPRGSLAFVAGTALLWTVFTDNTAGGSMLMYDPFILALWAGVTLAVVRESPIAIDVLVLAAALAKESAVALPLAAWWVVGRTSVHADSRFAPPPSR